MADSKLRTTQIGKNLSINRLSVALSASWAGSMIGSKETEEIENEEP